MRQLKNNHPTYSELIAKYQAKPKNYAACLNTLCPHSAECLHAKELTLVKTSPTLHVVNPQLYADPEQPCPMFRDGSADIYALGFEYHTYRMGYLKKPFQELCLKRIGPTTYYEMRKGLTAISPGLQAYIIACAHAVGYDMPADGFARMFPITRW